MSSPPLRKLSSKPPPTITKNSLLDMTYPYLKTSMLAQSLFYGFECLIFLIAVNYALIYLLTNYLQKGQILNWTVLQTIASNLLWDLQLVLAGIAMTLLQIYLGDLINRAVKNSNNKKMLMGVYCLIWFVVFVGGALFALSRVNFYFTDRILIVVCSWALPVKTASYCLDRLQGAPAHPLLTTLKFIISPLAIYNKFIANHRPHYPINKTYLLVKSLTAAVCLLINYILLTEFIAPYLDPSVYTKMSFAELFFRLTPLLFFAHCTLYYLIMENIMLAMGEITQLQNRIFYKDWWNAQTISQFLDKWVLLINSFSDEYLQMGRQVKHALHTGVIFAMLFSIFGETVTVKTMLFAAGNILTVYFMGDSVKIQNNYVVHMLTISFQPFCLAAILKYRIFS